MKYFYINLLSLILLLLLTWSFQGTANAMTPAKEPAIINCKLTFTTAVAANPNTIRIPFQLLGRLVAIEAKVDTIGGIFIVDTGAERLLLNKNYFDGRKLSASSSYGVAGKVQNIEEKIVDTLFWDNLKLDDLSAHLIDLSHIEQKRNRKIIGIIGYEVLKEFEVFLDYPFKQIVLTKLDRTGFRIEENVFYQQPIDSIDFELHNHGIILAGSIQGFPLKFNLDSGAELNLIDRKVPRKVLNNFKILKRAKLTGAGNQEIEVLAGLLSRVKCGNLPNYSMRTLLTSTDELSFIYGTPIQGVLGFEFLRSKRTLINYKRKKLYFFDMIRP